MEKEIQESIAPVERNAAPAQPNLDAALLLKHGYGLAIQDHNAERDLPLCAIDFGAELHRPGDTIHLGSRDDLHRPGDTIHLGYRNDLHRQSDANGGVLRSFSSALAGWTRKR